MVRSPSIQFRGLDQVLRAYQNQQIPNWAIFQGTQFLFSDDKPKLKLDEGEETLRGTLQMLDQSPEVYTIRVYKSVSDGITNATKYHGSFNFLLADQSKSDEYSDYRAGINRRLSGIEDTLKKLVPDDEPGDTPPAGEQISGINQLVGKILENPNTTDYIVGKLINLVERLVPSTVPPQPQLQQAAKVAGIPTDMSQIEKITRAIDIMLPVDPLLGDHLLKLATVAETAPDRFTNLLSMLNTFV